MSITVDHQKHNAAAKNTINIHTDASDVSAVVPLKNNYLEKTPDADILDKNSAKNTRQKSKNTKLKTLGIAGAAIAGFGALALFYKGKPANFAEHIDFTKASTMDEAREFAQKNFGIKTFDFKDDLEFANWVNEGLTNINNKFKGKAQMPKILGFVDEKLNQKAKQELKDYVALTKNIGKRVLFRENMFSRDNLISVARYNGDKLFQYNSNNKPQAIDLILMPQKEIEKLADTFDNLNKNPDAYSRLELREIVEIFRNATSVPSLHLKQALEHIMNNADIAQKINDAGYKIDVSDFSKMSIEKQKDFIQNLVDRFNINLSSNDVNTKGYSVFDTIYHEIGHVQHFKNSTVFDMLFGKLSKKAKLSDKEEQIALNLSNYAATSPHEFVAEAFNAIMRNEKLSDDAMELYQKYNGTMLPKISSIA